MTAERPVEVTVPGPDVPIAALDWGGDGDPIVFLHGGGSNAAEWTLLVPHLLDRFRCISYDAPGHGLTPAPPTLSFESHLAEIDAVVDHFALPRDRLVLVGASYGGAIAVWYASVRGGCRAVVGVDSAPTRAHLGPWPPPDLPERRDEDWPALGWGGSGDQAWYDARVAELLAEGEPEAMVRRAIRPGHDGLYHAYPRPEFLTASYNLGREAERSMGRVVDTYARLQRPTLLLCATMGVSVDNREFIDGMPDRFPGVEVAWLDGPHILDCAVPDLVAEHLVRFLGSLPEGTLPDGNRPGR